MSFVPRLDTLPTAQRSLWPELASVPRTFVLYGGTALALRLAHRQSVDFDRRLGPATATRGARGERGRDGAHAA